MVTGSLLLTPNPPPSTLTHMRKARIKVDGAVYHCVSRTVAGQFLLDDPAKHHFVNLLLPLAHFCGVEIITYCILSNHFHLLVRIPPPSHLPDSLLLHRAESFYGKHATIPSLARSDIQTSGAISPHLRLTLSSRMGDISAFMKELKQRFSRWFNQHSGRFGTLWAERFSSTLVENSPLALQTVAAYIDLNPVRAGLVSDPKDYIFCGYSKALAGNSTLQSGLTSILHARSWSSAAAQYRLNLFTSAASPGHSHKHSLSRQAIQAEIQRGGSLSVPEILRLRIRHLSKGVAIGSKHFVNHIFLLNRHHFGKKRTSGARPIRGAPLPNLHSLRDLRVNAVG